MKKLILTALIVVLGMAAFGQAQETRFGKNKVRYKDFNWKYVETKHFYVHFYEDAYPTAKFAAAVLESAYTEITGELDYVLQREDRVPVFVYNSHNDFQQTNIIPNLIQEGVGGFTEAFKTRIVIPFTGSYEDFRHVLHHELTHAITYDMLYGKSFSSLLSRQRLFSLPLWFAEGFAEYSSRHGWDYWADMIVRDATINSYLAPPSYLGGYLAYKQGQAMIKYIADTYGEEKLGEILRKGRVYLSMNRALKETIGIDEEKFWEDFSREMKRRYWPDIAERKEVDEIATQLTKAGEDGSYFNEEPVYSPEGDKIALFTDRSDYTEIILISSVDGAKVKTLVKAERSGDLESLHSYVSGMSFSPDGTQLVFVAKSGGQDALWVADVYNGGRKMLRRLPYYNVVSPTWSPDGEKILFSALKEYKRDLFVYYLDSGEVMQLTDDRYDDVEPTWRADSKSIIFSSDRAHPQTPAFRNDEHMYVSNGALMPGDFDYGYYNLFTVTIGDKTVEPLSVGPGQNKLPKVSPDGTKLAYISNRNGIDNLYIADLVTDMQYAVTDILSGVKSVSWAPDGEKIAFSAYSKGAFDVFVLKDLVPVGEQGQLAPTAYVRGKYDLLKKKELNRTLARHDSTAAPADDTTVAAVDDTPATMTDTLLAVAEDSAAAPLPLDSTAVAPIDDTLLAVADSTVTATDSAAVTDRAIVVETGLYDGEYVFISDEETDPLDSVLTDIEDDSTVLGRPRLVEPAFFDTVPPLLPSGEFRVKDYKPKFTSDYVGGGVAYDTYFGLRGQSYFMFSDYLGNHQFYIAANLVNTLDQSFIQAYYFNNGHRANRGGGVFHSKNYYYDNNDNYFSDRYYGVVGFLSRPFSTFSRIEMTTSQIFIDREYLEQDDPREDRSSKVTTAELAYVTDNIIWGITGPVNGRRAKISLSAGLTLFDSDDIDFQAAEFDYRKYWHMKKTYSMAFRLTGGASFGSTPKLYFLGGTTNWIGNRTLDARVYDVENLYFSSVVTPLRGLEYYDVSGNRFALANWEFRFPLIDYFIMRFPLPLAITRVKGAIFMDIGSAWTDNNFKLGTSEGSGSRLVDVYTGFGVGMRANLGFAVLRYDVAWSTDFNTVGDKSNHYFSFGADF